MTYGVYIDDINTLTEWGLILLDGVSEGSPKQKTQYIDLPGADGRLDLSTALSGGEPVFENRTVTFSLMLRNGDENELKNVYTAISNYCAGRKVKLWLPNDSDHYYYGRMTVGEKNTKYNVMIISMSLDADPFKYKNAETIINANMTGQEFSIFASNEGKRVFPELNNSGNNAITLKKGSQTFSVPSGKNMIPGLFLDYGMTELKVTGTSGTTLGITYKERIL